MDKLDDDYLGISALCLILSTYTDNHNIHNYNLDNLIDNFDNPYDISKIARVKMKNEFIKSYIFPMLDLLADGRAEKYAQRIKVLKDIGFESLWNTDIYPSVNEAVTGNISYITELFINIQKMKNIDKIDDRF